MSDFLTRRGATWHFVRRVPAEFAQLDRRGIIRHSTRIKIAEDRVGRRAARVADTLNEELERFWKGLASRQSSEGLARYDEARRRARPLGYSERGHAPDTPFDIRTLGVLPRVDIVYSCTGSDGTAVSCYVGKGAGGIISAGFAPTMGTPAEIDELKAGVARGVIVVQATRAGSGRTAQTLKGIEAGFINADNLTPQKSRLLLALALTVTREPDEIAGIFARY